eukprot:scaffold328_cov248-Pinguiococcus_pyrenoidosus.AAC.4
MSTSLDDAVESRRFSAASAFTLAPAPPRPKSSLLLQLGSCALRAAVLLRSGSSSASLTSERPSSILVETPRPRRRWLSGSDWLAVASMTIFLPARASPSLRMVALCSKRVVALMRVSGRRSVALDAEGVRARAHLHEVLVERKLGQGALAGRRDERMRLEKEVALVAVHGSPVQLGEQLALQILKGVSVVRSHELVVEGLRVVHTGFGRHALRRQHDPVAHGRPAEAAALLRLREERHLCHAAALYLKAVELGGAAAQKGSHAFFQHHLLARWTAGELLAQGREDGVEGVSG